MISPPVLQMIKISILHNVFLFDSLMEELPFTHLNEEDFRLAIFEQLNGPIRYDPDRLASLRFNPLLSETYKKFSLCSHHDPDANFFTGLVDCEYYTESANTKPIDW